MASGTCLGLLIWGWMVTALTSFLLGEGITCKASGQWWHGLGAQHMVLRDTQSS